MKKYDVLRIVVILQAVSMIALAGVVIWNVWGNPPSRGSNVTDVPVDGGNEPSSDIDGENEVMAVIGEEKITRSDLISALMDSHGDEVLQKMLAYKAIELEAEHLQFSVSTEELQEKISVQSEGYENEDAYFNMMKEQLGLSKSEIIKDMKHNILLEKIAIASIEITQEEIDSYIKQHAVEFLEKQFLHIGWILTADKKEANQILTLLENGSSFEELAIQFSRDSYSAAMGGDLGEIEMGDPFYDPVILTEAANIHVGNIVGPLEVREGYAIVQLLGRKVDKALSQQERIQLAQKEIALQKGSSLQQIQKELMVKYNYAIKKK